MFLQPSVSVFSELFDEALELAQDSEGRFLRERSEMQNIDIYELE